MELPPNIKLSPAASRKLLAASRTSFAVTTILLELVNDWNDWNFKLSPAASHKLSAASRTSFTVTTILLELVNYWNDWNFPSTLNIKL